MRDQDDRREVDPLLPWSFVLDPAANARALGEVQRRGLRAARELVERVTSTMDRPEHRGQPLGRTPADTGSDDPGARTPIDIYSQLVQGWWEFTASMVGAFLPNWSAEPSDYSEPPRDTAPTVDVTRASGLDLWRLQVDPTGWVRRGGQLWLQNPSPDPIGGLFLSVSDLRADSGPAIGSSRVCLDPSSISVLSARSARSVLIELRPERRMAPGTHRGLLLIEGAIDLQIPIEIEVRTHRSDVDDWPGSDRAGM
jgi:hypothetical protein